METNQRKKQQQQTKINRDCASAFGSDRISVRKQIC